MELLMAATYFVASTWVCTAKMAYDYRVIEPEQQRYEQAANKSEIAFKNAERIFKENEEIQTQLCLDRQNYDKEQKEYLALLEQVKIAKEAKIIVPQKLNDDVLRSNIDQLRLNITKNIQIVEKFKRQNAAMILALDFEVQKEKAKGCKGVKSLINSFENQILQRSKTQHLAKDFLDNYYIKYGTDKERERSLMSLDIRNFTRKLQEEAKDSNFHIKLKPVQLESNRINYKKRN